MSDEYGAWDETSHSLLHWSMSWKIIPSRQRFGIGGAQEGYRRFPDLAHRDACEEIALSTAISGVLAMGARCSPVDHRHARTNRRPIGRIERAEYRHRW